MILFLRYFFFVPFFLLFLFWSLLVVLLSSRSFFLIHSFKFVLSPLSFLIGIHFFLAVFLVRSFTLIFRGSLCPFNFILSCSFAFFLVGIYFCRCYSFVAFYLSFLVCSSGFAHLPSCSFTLSLSALSSLFFVRFLFILSHSFVCFSLFRDHLVSLFCFSYFFLFVCYVLDISNFVFPSKFWRIINTAFAHF